MTLMGQKGLIRSSWSIEHLGLKWPLGQVLFIIMSVTVQLVWTNVNWFEI